MYILLTINNKYECFIIGRIVYWRRRKKEATNLLQRMGKMFYYNWMKKSFFLFIKLSSIVMYLFDINKLSWKGFHSLLESVSLNIFETNSKLNIF